MLSRLKTALRAILRRAQAERELDEELRDHVDRQTEQNIRLGMTAEEARSAALKTFGGVEQAKEKSRDARGVRWLEDLWHDLRYGIRMLLKAPGFTLIAILTLALGIGANTAMFSILDAWLFRPLAFKDSDQLVIVLRNDLKRPTEPAYALLYRDFEALKEQSRSFESLSGVFWRRYLLTGTSEPEELDGMIATFDLFTTIGVPALRGRAFSRDDLSGPPVTVISHRFWQLRFGGSVDAIGSSLTLNGVSHRIIGVMPPDFDLRMLDQSAGAVLWTLLPTAEPGYRLGSVGPIAAIGRLKPGFAVTTAQSELTTILRQSEAKYPDTLKGSEPLVARLQADNSRTVRLTLLSLAATVAFILLITCTNLGGLLLARAARRRQEMAIRAAIGSGRRRLVTQLLTENLLLALFGAMAGLLLAHAVVRLVITINPLGRAPSNAIAVDTRALCFTLGLTFLTTALFGLLPALRASKVDLNTILKSGSRGASDGTPGRRAMSAMVTAQIALTVVLLIGAGLMVRTLVRLRAEPLGFHDGNVTVAKLALPADSFSQENQRNSFYDRLLEKIAAIPGARSAAVTNHPLLDGGGPRASCVIESIEGQEQAAPDNAPRCGGQIVTPDYFSSLSIPLLRGRAFISHDHERAEKVVIIDDLIAGRSFPGRDPVGQRIRTRKDSPWRKIVGVVGTTRATFKNYDFAWQDSPKFFIPHRQSTESGFSPVGNNVWVYIRATGRLAISDLRRAISSVDGNVAIVEFRPLREMVADATRQPLLRTVLFSGFAILALMLAALGVYGVVSQSVAQRTNEIGIRMALGASPRDVLVVVARQGMIGVLIGAAVGLAASFAAARLMSSMLYSVSATDPMTFVASALLLTSVAFLACWIPARRAARVDPLVALRCN